MEVNIGGNTFRVHKKNLSQLSIHSLLPFLILLAGCRLSGANDGDKLPTEPGSYEDPRSTKEFLRNCRDNTDEGFKEIYDKSDVAFLGTVTEVKPVPERKVFEVTFEVKKIWKGPETKTVMVEFAPESDQTSIIQQIRVGRKILGFPYGSPLYQHHCSILSGADYFGNEKRFKQMDDYLSGRIKSVREPGAGYR